MASTFTQLLKFGPLMYLPTVFYSVGQSALIPVIPVLAQRLGADIGVAGLVASAMVVGQVCGNIPSSWAVSRFSERRTMGGAALLSIVGTIGVGLAPHLAMLTVAAFFIGLCGSAFGLARHAFMTTHVPIPIRARGLSLLGGTYRLGYAIGPFVSSGVLVLGGEPRLVPGVFAVCLAAVAALLAWGKEPRIIDPGPEGGLPAEAASFSGVVERREALFTLVWRYRSLLGTLGAACATLGAVRAVRLMILPLWGLSIGASPEMITVVAGLSGVVDFALFYLGGQVMDHFGRRWVAVSSTFIIGLALLALAFTHDVSANETWFVIAAVVLGVGNGIGSGILITLASDAAPRRDPAPFLGAWRFITDGGGALGPVVLSAIAVISLPISVGVIGVVALTDAVWLGILIPARAKRDRRMLY